MIEMQTIKLKSPGTRLSSLTRPPYTQPVVNATAPVPQHDSVNNLDLEPDSWLYRGHWKWVLKLGASTT